MMSGGGSSGIVCESEGSDMAAVGSSEGDASEEYV
jgi:hypothetical protein